MIEKSINFLTKNQFYFFFKSDLGGFKDQKNNAKQIGIIINIAAINVIE